MSKGIKLFQSRKSEGQRADGQASSELSQLPRVKAILTVLTRSEGGRRSPFPDHTDYRPHIVVGDPRQRVTTVGPDGKSTEQYLGINFMGCGRVLMPGQEHEVEFALVYHPRVDYSEVVKGATFTVREGGRVVAFGQITDDVHHEGS